MFRAQANQFDDVVVKATDENLTSENWEYILDVCDKVGATDSGAKDVVAALIKRLAHRNANVQLYTLELANALSQNCGLKIHKELASRSFTDALLRLANDRNTHQQVKAKILERMGEWTEMFSKDPDLGIMEQAYMRLKTQNPNLRPPSKPQKTQITDTDRQKEEEELQMALALSIKETPTQPTATSSNQPQPSSAQSAPEQQQQQHQAISSGTTAATVSRVRALYDFTPSEPGELAFRKGDIIAVLESVYKDWWKGSLRGQTGIFPLNYVEKLQDPTKEELEREAQMEAEVFAEIKNVEKLLALLSTNSSADARDNEEVTGLYHKTVAIRPKLIELIGKYSQKKDDFTQLNEKFIKARRDYEALLEASMSQAAQPGYGRQPYGYGAGGVQPQGAPYGGYPPQGPPHERFYSPVPAAEQGYGYPPQNGPQPFSMAPPGQAPPQAQITSPKPPNGEPYVPPQRVPVGGRPQSMAFPQEMAANSPVESRPPQQAYDAYPPQPSQAPPPAPTNQAPYPPQQQPNRQPSYDSPSAPYAPQQLPQGPSDPYAQHQPQPSVPGAYPGAPTSNTPPPGQSPYMAYNQSTATLPPAGGAAPSAPGGYQAYNPNAAAQAPRWGQQPAAMAGGGARDDADGFYR